MASSSERELPMIDDAPISGHPSAQASITTDRVPTRSHRAVTACNTLGVAPTAPIAIGEPVVAINDRAEGIKNVCRKPTLELMNPLGFASIARRWSTPKADPPSPKCEHPPWDFPYNVRRGFAPIPRQPRPTPPSTGVTPVADDATPRTLAARIIGPLPRPPAGFSIDAYRRNMAVHDPDSSRHRNSPPT